MKEIIIFIILALEVFADVNLKFFQKDYHVVPEWFEVVSYDKKYVKDMAGRWFKHNRTVGALNLTYTFNVDLGNRWEIILQVYKFASNEYREFPLRVQYNFCQAIAQDTIGLGNILKCGNCTGCPLVKGRKYHFCNWTPDESKLPPYIPSGRYMTEFQGLYNSLEMYIWRGYYAITRPEV